MPVGLFASVAQGAWNMPASIFIAKLLGPIFVVLAVGLMLREQAFRRIVEDFNRSPALIYLAGFLGLLSGLALVLTHNVWLLDWRVIITLIGWIAIVRAVLTILAPQQIVAFGSKVLAHRGLFLAIGVVNLCVGLVLSYFGYWS